MRHIIANLEVGCALGIITSFVEKKNNYTDELIYLLDIESNDLAFTIAINKNDLLGEPAVGRRFKGDIWLQGHVVI